MGKKRRKDKSSREEDDVELTGPSCRHIKKGTEQTLLKKLSGTSDWTGCQDCKHHGNVGADPQRDSEDEEEEASVWMCLKCGHRGCGRTSTNQHAIKHYETPRSDPHCMVVSVDSWSVWCYICDDEVQYSRTGQLAQLVTNLRKQTSSPPVRTEQEQVQEEDGRLEVQAKTSPLEVQAKTSPSEVQAKTSPLKAEGCGDKENKEQPKRKKEKTAGSPKVSGTSEVNAAVSVKGLTNLGNTCFFNAVVQNLSQTQLLRRTIQKVKSQGEEISLNVEPSSDLEPIEVELDRPGSLTLAMYKLLNEIQESKAIVVTPQALFREICKKAARFQGFQQQDSQELLRYLLDGMRAEEIKRVSSGITKTLKESGKSLDGDELKTLLKKYEKHGFPKNFVDHVFGGEMTSTIMCQQCKTVSVVTEKFLDLSLPVSEEAYRKKNQKKGAQSSSGSSQDAGTSLVLTNGDGDAAATPGSKYQQKKEKRQAKKQAKHHKRQQKLEGRATLDCLTSDGRETDPPADPEECRENGTQEEGSPPQTGSAEPDLNTTQRAKEEDEDSVTDGDSAAAAPSVNNRFTVLSEEQPSKDGVRDLDQTSDTEKEEKEEEEEEEEEGGRQLVSEMEKVTLDDAFIGDSDASAHVEESEDEPLEAVEYTVVGQDPEVVFLTLAPRTAPEQKERSVQTCFHQFTAVETLTQNNSLLCGTCTKRQPPQDKGPKKSVYTDALKQMLISSPPPVLTLHLKRFQQRGVSICKVDTHVQFPMVLDLAPFCGVTCKNLSEGEARVPYSLYGIVQHSGTMRSGHYIAYVKARAEPSPDGGADSPRGSWFCVSDTSVKSVSESEVQRCQAYLLFYERIL